MDCLANAGAAAADAGEYAPNNTNSAAADTKNSLMGDPPKYAATRITYFDARGRYMDKEKFEGFKTRFYKLQGWDTASGYPTRGTLESIGLGYVGDELEKNGRLGKA